MGSVAESCRGAVGFVIAHGRDVAIGRRTLVLAASVIARADGISTVPGVDPAAIGSVYRASAGDGPARERLRQPFAQRKRPRFSPSAAVATSVVWGAATAGARRTAKTDS